MRGIQVVSRSQALEQLVEGHCGWAAGWWTVLATADRARGKALACIRCRGCVSSAANRELVLSTDNYRTRDKAGAGVST